MGVDVRIVKEYMTTKLCSRCLEINNPGRSKVYKCKKCKLETDRDYNPGKLIYIQEIGKIILEIIRTKIWKK